MTAEDLREAMTRLASGLRDSLATSGAIGHALTRGEVREAEVIEGLRPHIPKRFGLATGEVINASGARSRQQDVIISDQLAGTPFLARGGIGVFPIEIVYAVIQVKSQISPSTVREAVENITSVKRLIGDQPRNPMPHSGALRWPDTTRKPYGAIFAFSATTDLEKVGDAFLAANAVIPHRPNRCDSLVVLDRAQFLWAQRVIHLSQGGPWAGRFGAKGDGRLERWRPGQAWMGAEIDGRWGSG